MVSEKTNTPFLAAVFGSNPTRFALRSIASMQLVLFIGMALTVHILREASKIENKSQTVDTLE